MVQRNLPIRYAQIWSIRRRTATHARPSITYNPSSCQLMFHLAERENSKQTADDKSAVRLENEYAFSSQYMSLNHLLQRTKNAPPKSTSSNLLVKRAGKACTDLPFFLNTLRGGGNRLTKHLVSLHGGGKAGGRSGGGKGRGLCLDLATARLRRHLLCSLASVSTYYYKGSALSYYFFIITITSLLSNNILKSFTLRRRKTKWDND